MELLSEPHLVQCGHSFCFECIYLWLKTSKKCPACRAVVRQPPSLNLGLRDEVDAVVETLPVGQRVKILEMMEKMKGELLFSVFFP
jgi:hypothetical protein